MVFCGKREAVRPVLCRVSQVGGKSRAAVIRLHNVVLAYSNNWRTIDQWWNAPSICHVCRKICAPWFNSTHTNMLCTRSDCVCGLTLILELQQAPPLSHSGAQNHCVSLPLYSPHTMHFQCAPITSCARKHVHRVDDTILHRSHLARVPQDAAGPSPGGGCSRSATAQDREKVPLWPN